MVIFSGIRITELHEARVHNCTVLISGTILLSWTCYVMLIQASCSHFNNVVLKLFRGGELSRCVYLTLDGKERCTADFIMTLLPAHLISLMRADGILTRYSFKDMS